MSIYEIRRNDTAADRLAEALASHPCAPYGSFDFQLDGARILLTGSVASLDEKAAIYEVIDDFAMIRDVEDRLQIVPPAPSFALAA